MKNTTSIHSLAALAFAATAVGMLATSAQAATIAVTNHSFEGGTTDWITNGGADEDGGWYSDPMPDGTWFAWTNANNQSHSATLGETLQADTTYTMTVATGWRNDLPGLGFPNYPGYRVELWAGGNLLSGVADAQNGGGVDASIALEAGVGSGEWKDVTVTYTSPSSVTPGQALEIRLLGGQNVNGGGANAIQTSYDNVRLDGTMIPEPSSAALLGLGGLVLLRRRRK